MLRLGFLSLLLTVSFIGLQAFAAKNGKECATVFNPGSVGHYMWEEVKANPNLDEKDPYQKQAKEISEILDAIDLNKTKLGDHLYINREITKLSLLIVKFLPEENFQYLNWVDLFFGPEILDALKKELGFKQRMTTNKSQLLTFEFEYNRKKLATALAHILFIGKKLMDRVSYKKSDTPYRSYGRSWPDRGPSRPRSS